MQAADAGESFTHPFLYDLPKEHLEILIGLSMLTAFHEDEMIFREGDPANRFF